MIIPTIIFLISLISTLLVMPWLIRYLKRIGLLVKDQNKKDKPLIPISGGLAVMGGIFLGLMSYISIRIFAYNDTSSLLYFFAAITTILLISVVGFIDDSIIKRNKNASTGLKQWQKPLLTLIAAIPLVAIKAGTSTISVPLFGSINFGILYPLLIVPLLIMFLSNAVNLLAGFNGLEAGMGLIYTGMLGLYAYVNGSYVAAMIALTTFASLIAFLKFNWFPAKIFPGDSLTYLLGAALACIAILGNMEKAVLIVSIPFLIEFILKARSRFKAQSFGYWKNSKIQSLYENKVYSLTHIFTRTGKFTEKQIVIFLMIIELIFCLLIWI